MTTEANRLLENHLATLPLPVSHPGKMREVLVTVVSDLGNEPKRLRRHPPSVLTEQNARLILRHHREQLAGRWQGPIVVPPGSVILCLGLGSPADTIAAELLVRALREQDRDARHVGLEDLAAYARPPGAGPGIVGAVYLVSAFPNPEREQSASMLERVRQRFAQSRVISVLLPGILLPADLPAHLNIFARCLRATGIASVRVTECGATAPGAPT